ncbi:MAG: hypothetical protein ACJAVA_001652 [Flavobacteriaceae bacterium]|jgi:hypothetical protein
MVSMLAQDYVLGITSKASNPKEILLAASRVPSPKVHWTFDFV